MRRTLQRLALALATIAACNRDPPPPLDSADVAVEAPPQSPPPEVEFAGCQATRREPLTCWLRTETTHLNLWVGARQPPIIEVDGKPAVARVWPSMGDIGWTVAVDVPRSAGHLAVRLNEGVHTWTLDLEPTPPTPTVTAIEARMPADNELDAARLTETLAELDAALPRLSDYEAIAAGRVRLLLLKDLGRLDDAISSGHETLDRALAAGRIEEALTLIEMLVFLAIQRGDGAEAEFLLDLHDLHVKLGVDAAHRLRGEYYRGFWASSVGELRLALDHLESAEGQARRLGLRDDELASASLRAPLLGLVGRSVERVRLVDRILTLTRESPRAERCRSAVYLSNAGWALLLAREREGRDDIAARLFERALAFYTPSGGCDPSLGGARRRSLQEARINYALEAITRGEWHAAAERMLKIEADVLAPSQTAWLRYMQAELAMANSDPAAATELLRDSPARADLLLAWQADVLRARALERLGREREALAANLRAEQLLDEVVLRLGIDQGREGLSAGMHSSAAAAIRLHLARGDRRAAVAVARHSRTRAMRPIGRTETLARLAPSNRQAWIDALERYRSASAVAAGQLNDAWRLPQDQRDRLLREQGRTRKEMRTILQQAYSLLGARAVATDPGGLPEPGHAWLLFHPLHEGWVGLALTSTGVIASNVSIDVAHATPSELSDQLLLPFADVIDNASRVDILAMGDLDRVEFHALPWRGNPLLAQKRVAYRLDIGTGASLGPARSAARSALVIADPASTRPEAAQLPEARLEGDLVTSWLRDAGWTVATLQGDAADHATVMASLPQVDWLHYAGHGLAAGGWDSALPLAGEGQLGVRDILALPKVPPAVVLSGCRTGALDPQHGVDGQHLASAFLLAGSHFAIATSADVPDAVAREFAGALYQAVLATERLDGADLLRTALVKLATDRGESFEPWQHFRAWVP